MTQYLLYVKVPIEAEEGRECVINSKDTISRWYHPSRYSISSGDKQIPPPPPPQIKYRNKPCIFRCLVGLSSDLKAFFCMTISNRHTDEQSHMSIITKDNKVINDIRWSLTVIYRSLAGFVAFTFRFVMSVTVWHLDINRPSCTGPRVTPPVISNWRIWQCPRV